MTPEDLAAIRERDAAWEASPTDYSPAIEPLLADRRALLAEVDREPGLFTFDAVAPSEKPIDLTEYQRIKREGVVLPSRFSRTHY